jgi:hypothetical protein
VGLVSAAYHWYVVRLGFLSVLSVSDVTIGSSPSELRETLSLVALESCALTCSSSVGADAAGL